MTGYRGAPVNPGTVNMREWNDSHGTPGGGEQLTQQHLGVEYDINTILRRFNVTGQMPLGVPPGVYGDFTGIEDWSDAVGKIEKAKEDFMRLPPELREKFDNNPGLLIQKAQSMSEEEFYKYVEPVKAPVAPVEPGKAAP